MPADTALSQPYRGRVMPATDLNPGQHILVNGTYLGDADGFMVHEQVRVAILRGPEACTEPGGPLEGAPRIRFWCQREDTGREGWMLYGPGGAVRLDERA